MTVQSVSNDDKKWRQEDDARTLAQAATIQADTARMKGAASAAKRMLAEQEKQTEGLRAVAGSAPAKKRSEATKPFTLPRIGGKK